MHPYQRGRSHQFVEYLRSLPPDERQRIEAVEAQFVHRREDRYSRQVQIERVFESSKLGFNERVPFYLTRR